jgi:hypothetical protein
LQHRRRQGEQGDSRDDLPAVAIGVQLLDTRRRRAQDRDEDRDAERVADLAGHLDHR